MPTSQEIAATAGTPLYDNTAYIAALTAEQAAQPQSQSQAATAMQDQANETAKYQALYSQPRDDTATAHSAAFDAINAQYQASRNQVVSSSGSISQGPVTSNVNPYPENTAAGIAWEVARTGGATDFPMNAIATAEVLKAGGDPSFIRYATDVYQQRPSFQAQTLTTKTGETFTNPEWSGVPIRSNLTLAEMQAAGNPNNPSTYYRINPDTLSLDKVTSPLQVGVDSGVHSVTPSWLSGMNIPTYDSISGSKTVAGSSQFNLTGGFTNIDVSVGRGQGITVRNAQLVGDYNTGEFGIYQKTYDPNTGKERSMLNLVGGGGRAALQSGQFAWGGESLSPADKTFEQWDMGKITALPASYFESYSGRGAEAYGGFSGVPLDNRTIESTGAQLSTYASPWNLANLVNPQGANMSKTQAPGIDLAFSIPQGGSAVTILNYQGSGNTLQISPDMGNLTGGKSVPTLTQVSGYASDVLVGGNYDAYGNKTPFKSFVSNGVDIKSQFVATMDSDIYPSVTRANAIETAKSTTYTYRTDPLAVVLEGATLFGDTLLFGVATPGKDLLKSYGQGDNVALTEFNANLASVTAQKPTIDTLGATISAERSSIDAMTAGKLNAQGQFTGTSEEYDKYTTSLSKLNSDGATYNKYGVQYQDVISKGIASGAIIQTKGGYLENPDLEHPYGAFSDWSRGATQMFRGGTTESDIIRYENSEQYANAGLPMQFGESSWKAATNPVGLAQSALQGVELYATMGVAELGLASLAPAAVVGEGGALTPGVATTLSERVGAGGLALMRNEYVQAGVGSIFVGQSVYEGTNKLTEPAKVGGVAIGLGAMALGGISPELAATANPRLSYVQTEQYNLRMIDQPSPISPSGVFEQQTLTRTVDPYHMNLNIWGRDIALPESVRGTPRTTTEVRVADIGTQVAGLLQGSELYPTTGTRQISLRGEFPALENLRWNVNPFFEYTDMVHVTGELRIGEAALPRTYQDYFQSGAQQARTRGLSLEETTAALMAEDAMRPLTTTGYRVADVFATRGTPLFEAVYPDVPRTDGMGIEFNRIDREADVYSYTQTVTGGRGAPGSISIIRDVLGGEGGSVILEGSMHPEARVVIQLQEVSRTLTGRGDVERAFAFDQRGRLIFEETGTRGAVGAMGAKSAANNLGFFDETASIAHTHPLDYITDYVNADAGIRNIGDLIYEREIMNTPSSQDLEIMGVLNTRAISAEYIATPKGVLKFSPDARGNWDTFSDASITAEATEAGGFYNVPDMMRSVGARAEFISNTRQYTPREAYGEQVGGVSGEIRNAQDAISTRIFSDALQRRAMGNPLLEFAPERAPGTPTPRGGPYGRTYERPDRGNGPEMHSPMSPMAEVSMAPQRESYRISTVPRESPASVEVGKTTNVRAFNDIASDVIPAREESSFRGGAILMPVAASVSAMAQTPSLASASVSRSAQIQSPPQDYVRAYMMGSDLSVKQDQKQEKDLVRAFVMGNDFATPQDQSRINAMASATALDKAQAQIQRQTTIQETKQVPYKDIVPIEPIPIKPVVHIPVVGLPWGGSGGLPPSGLKKNRRGLKTEYFTYAPANLEILGIKPEPAQKFYRAAGNGKIAHTTSTGEVTVVNHKKKNNPWGL